MKAKLEPKEIQHRGVSLVSETEEEKRILLNLWNEKAKPAMLSRLPDGQVEVVVAPVEGG